MYCKQHAEDGRVNVRHKRCLHGTWSSLPSFYVKGSKPPVICKQHAVDGMVNVVSKRC
ncbi:unnamed protein product, partial [Laminaria digitata]